MKKAVSLMLALVVAFSLIGCGDSEKQEALLDYINNDLVEMGNIEGDLLASYESVTGDNYTSDLATYTEFTTNTAKLALELNDMAVEISGDITDEEILETHRIYMNYSNKFMNVINIMISAVENQDMALMTEANEKLNEANNLALDFKRELFKLAEEYDIEIKQ